jgi:putative DNA methylase
MTDYPVKSPRKLIEVALPLDAINVACAREKSIRYGHPSTLHLWWARRPLAAARAVIFAQLVNDPGYQQGGGFKYGKNKKDAAIERKRLFKIIEDLVLWENTTNEEVVERARSEIRRSWREVCELNKDHPQAAGLFNPDKLPALHDPFAGGGAIPLEAQRLGLEAYASDLNPVAVLINKAMIEIPPKFVGRPPVSLLQSSTSAKKKELNLEREWPGATGLAEDVRYYGNWMRQEAHKRIGHLYPPVEITAKMTKDRPDLIRYKAKTLTVVAWLWVRTVKSPNPAFSNVDVPLVSSFMLSPMEGREVYVEPVVEDSDYRFTVKVGKPLDIESTIAGTKLGRGSNFKCLMSGTPISGDYIKAQGVSGRLGQRLFAVVAEGERERVYVAPDAAMESTALQAIPTWSPDVTISGSTQYLGVKPYGIEKFAQLFTNRQLVALTTFADLVAEAREKATRDALAATTPLSADREFGDAKQYGDAVAIYLGFLVSKLADKGSTICTWDIGPTSNRTPSGRSARVATVRVTFSRQAFQMTWDFAEVNFFSESVGSIDTVLRTLTVPLDYLPVDAPSGWALQLDAGAEPFAVPTCVISTDPPYFDNVPYADLSDFFYVWLRRCLKPVIPELFTTLAVPKAEELVAFAYRHNGKAEAEAFFLTGMTRAMRQLAQRTHPAFPITIYYAFKQSDSDGGGTSNTGWETFLDAVIRAELAICGTWPMRTELGSRMRGMESNVLASSIILVCRKRPADAASVSRREFIRELNGVLPEALDEMTKGSGDERSPVAPVDLSQAIIGPGMAVFSKYSAVLEADGSPMSVRTALQLINRFLAEDDFDADTQFCLRWFEQHGWTDGAFGDADTLSRSKGTSVDGMNEAGVLKSGGGKVRLLKWAEYPTEWDPRTDTRTPIWEALHQLIRALKQGGEASSGALLAALVGKAEAVRQLAYRLYTLCERIGQAEDARAYNELITSWTGIESAAASAPKSGPSQGTLFEPNEH